MRRVILFVLALPLLTFTFSEAVVMGGDQSAGDAVKAETEKLKGTWTIVSEDGFRKGEKWVIVGGRIREGERDPVHRFYRLDLRKMPKEIDITIMAQPDGGEPLEVLEGIYSLEGDELKLCLASPGKERPASFPQKPGPGQVLLLKRQEP